jgi:predicted DNA-binding transcriptional regulator AlpA
VQRLLSVQKLAESLGRHPNSIRRMAREGCLPAPIRINNRLLFDEAELTAWLAAAKKESQRAD